MSEKPIVIIDAYAQIYRMFYGIRGNLKSPEGFPTNAIYGIARLLMSLERDYNCEYAAVAYDLGKCTTRFALKPDYKANRKPMPDELRVQLPYIEKWFEYAGWPILQEEGREADDIIAAVAQRNEGHKTLIVSNDKDLMQLVNENVHQLISGQKNTLTEIDREGVFNKFQVYPEQVIDYLSLLGDAVDNIPGVEGVGAKTAAKLLTEYKTVENLLANIDNVSGKRVKENLAKSGDLLELNRKMIQLYSEAPVNWNGLETIKKKPAQPDKLKALAQELGFKSILKEIESLVATYQNPMLF